MFDTFLYFLSLCWSSHCVHPFFFWVWSASLWPLLWTLFQGDCLSPFCLVLFLRFYLVLSIGTYSSVSSFYLVPCAYFYVLGKSAISPSLEGVTLFRRCPVGLRSAIPPIHQSQELKGCSLCGLYAPSYCGGTTAAAVCWWAGLLPHSPSCEAQLRCRDGQGSQWPCPLVLTG